MKCQCGEVTFELTEVLGPHKILDGEEVAYFHNQRKCGWAYECMDCWGTGGAGNAGFSTGFDSEADATAALRRHIENYCPTNKAVVREESAT